jgi:hypothetical protein
MFALGLGQLMDLGPIIHPPTTTAIFTALFHTGVPHRRAHRTDLLGILAPVRR